MARQLPPDFDLERDGDKMYTFDGPHAFDSEKRFAAKMDAEIAAAGGIDAWRAQHAKQQPAEKQAA